MKIVKDNVPIENNIRENIKTMIPILPWTLALEVVYVITTLLEGLIRTYEVGLLHIKSLHTVHLQNGLLEDRG